MKRMFLKKSQKFIFHRIIPQKYTKTFNSEVKQRLLVLGWVGDRKSIYFPFLKFRISPPVCSTLSETLRLYPHQPYLSAAIKTITSVRLLCIKTILDWYFYIIIPGRRVN